MKMNQWWVLGAKNKSASGMEVSTMNESDW
jgi:hypothetical protein